MDGNIQYIFELASHDILYLGMYVCSYSQIPYIRMYTETYVWYRHGRHWWCIVEGLLGRLFSALRRSRKVKKMQYKLFSV